MAGKRRLQRTAVVSGNAAYDTCTCRGRVFRTHARADVGRVVELGTALTRRDPLGRRAVGGRHVPGQRHGVASGDAVRADGGPVVGAAGRRCVHGRQRRRATAAIAECGEFSLPGSPIDASRHVLDFRSQQRNYRDAETGSGLATGKIRNSRTKNARGEEREVEKEWAPRQGGETVSTRLQ
jgi:hypothetical protein